MSKSPRIMLAMGTRPEIIKMAPVYRELKQRGLSPQLLHTGQHSDIAYALYDLFDMMPNYELELSRIPVSEANGQQHCVLAELGSELLRKTSDVMMHAKPDIVMVHGDTSSAMMSALAAYYQQRKVAHVEAGLRSHEEYHPFPEEKNRILIARLARWHFAPTERARKNLLEEGTPENCIHVVGNTIVQAANLGAARLDVIRRSGESASAFIDTLRAALPGRRMVLVTAHRRENHGAGIASVMQAVRELLERLPDLMVVWPVHPNPTIVASVNAEVSAWPASISTRIHITRPLDYPLLLWVLKHSWVVLTDSGGIQEEAVALKTPVLVLRDTTERPEVIEVGAGMIVGTDVRTIVSRVEALYADEATHAAMKSARNPFGDDTVAANICNILLGNSL